MERDPSFVELCQTLQGLIDVQKPASDSLLRRPAFLARCRLVTPDWNARRMSRIFVDGFVGKCYSNSCQVYRNGSEEDLALWVGYALARGQWWEHAWCMIDDLIIESTHPFDAYYGSDLSTEEREWLLQNHRFAYPTMHSKNVRIYTYEDGVRHAVPYQPDIHSAGIGRERDPISGKLRVGLGRPANAIINKQVAATTQQVQAPSNSDFGSGSA